MVTTDRTPPAAGYALDSAWHAERDRLDSLTRLYDPGTLELCSRLGVAPGWRCLDVGAQTGFYTCLMASRAGPGGSVVAIEPMPQSFELLARNVAENGYQDRVELHAGE